MPEIKPYMTKTGKKMFLTEVNGKTYASFDETTVKDFLAGKEVGTRQGSGNWVFLNTVQNQNSEQPNLVQPQAVQAVETPAPKVVQNGKNNLVKERLVQIAGELSEIARAL